MMIYREIWLTHGFSPEISKNKFSLDGDQSTKIFLCIIVSGAPGEKNAERKWFALRYILIVESAVFAEPALNRQEFWGGGRTEKGTVCRRLVPPKSMHKKG
jgi:hypothetical protein